MKNIYLKGLIFNNLDYRSLHLFSKALKNTQILTSINKILNQRILDDEKLNPYLITVILISFNVLISFNILMTAGA